MIRLILYVVVIMCYDEGEWSDLLAGLDYDVVPE